MSYARIVKIATLLSLLSGGACVTAPPETSTEPTVDPCDGIAVESTPYHDEHDEPILPGGTIHPGGTAGHLLSFEPGQTIAAVRVHIVPQHHEGPLPRYLPTLDVRKETEIGDGPGSFVADPFQARGDAGDATVATDYDRPHDLVIEPGWLTEAGTSYFVGLGGETGPGALDVQVCGTSVEFK